MAISKLVLNGEVQMDVTSDTVTAGSMLSGTTATKNDGTKATGTIASKSSTDMTVSGATVTAPAGYYANAASKAVATTTHPNPSASITSSTGVVTASHTQGTGYVTGGTTTGTLNLTTQAGKTVTPTEAAQTAVASYRWTTGPVSVAAISSTYVGTGVAKKSAADLTVNGSTVTAPIGYYSSAVSKAVAAGSAFPPAVTITKAPTFSMNSSTGVITASYTGSSSITPTVNAGYVSQGTAGTVSTTGTSSFALATQAAQTITPGSVVQTIASNRWLTGTQTIEAIPSTYKLLPSTFLLSGTFVSSVWSITYNGSYLSKLDLTLNVGDTITITNISTEAFPISMNYHQLFNLLPHSSIEIPIGPGNVSIVGYSSYYGFSIQNKGANCLEDLMYNQVINSSVMSTQISLDNRYTWLGSYAFYQTEYLESIIGTNICGLGPGCFERCYSLATVSFPNLYYMAQECFAYCSSLTQIQFDNIQELSSSCFSNCKKLTTVSLPMATYIGQYAFCSCSSLLSINFPMATQISAYAFDHCTSLATISLPMVSDIGSSAFTYCYSLTTVSLPIVTTIQSSAFAYCTSLTTVSLPIVTKINNFAFYNCRNLLSLYLLGSSIPTIAASVFVSTPIAGYTASTGGVYGSIFVPASLYNDYITATNWSRYSSRFVSV